MPNGQMKKFWRCNQWYDPFHFYSLRFILYKIQNVILILCDIFTLIRWNQKCRSRVYTLGDIVTVLHKYHTHEDIIHRKKRVAKKRTEEDKEFSDIDYLLASNDKKETSEDEDGTIFCVTYEPSN